MREREPERENREKRAEEGELRPMTGKEGDTREKSRVEIGVWVRGLGL